MNQKSFVLIVCIIFIVGGIWYYKIKSAEVPGVVNHKDYSGLDFGVGDNAELLVINPNQQRTGFNSATANDVQDIKNSSYVRDRIDNDETGARGPTSHLLNIYQPMEGVYEVYVIGLASGDYDLSVRAFSQDPNRIQPPIDVHGQTQKGLITKYILQYQKSAGAISKLLPSTQ